MLEDGHPIATSGLGGIESCVGVLDRLVEIIVCELVRDPATDGNAGIQAVASPIS